MVGLLPRRHRVFVYGTLKRTFTNYERYLGVAVEHGKASFLCEAATVECFPLVVRPPHMHPPTCGPVMMEQTGSQGHRIPGEIFEVDDSTLEGLDIVEGVRSGGYYKQDIAVEPCGGVETLVCTAYLYPASGELLVLPLLQEYTAEHLASYKPREVRQDVVELCKKPAPHVLSTSQPCSMTVHCLRMLPGEDVLLSLKAFVETHGIEAANVLSCVGSTGKTTLRPAGVPVPKEFDSKFEIVSLTGTVSTSGHHLHMSISDPDCNVFGGHVLEGCIVRTTAELTLGIISGLRFTRPLDARTGYDELSMTPLPTAGSCSGSAKRRKLNGGATDG